MATELTNYRVFIASPGGLEKEREAFRDVLRSHNDADAIQRGAIFTPVGWEITLRGIGRAQEKINEEVKQCDYFILVLWDRWGSPPDSGKKYTSGTEEEYNIAWDCYKNSSHPMRDIIVLFKTVDIRQLSDPGLQLQAVLNFKKKLEAEKILFFDTFDDQAAFEEKLRRYLALWTRNHETGGKSKVSDVQDKKDDNGLNTVELSALTAPVTGKVETESRFVRDAETLLKQGKLTDAEAKLVQAVISGVDLAAFRSYGNFLMKANRLTDAEAVFEQMLKIARDTNELSWAATAMANIGGIYRLRKNYSKAQVALKQALVLNQKAANELGAAYVFLWLGDLNVQRTRLEDAANYFQNSLRLLNKLESPPHLRADVQVKLAKALLKTGNAAQAQILDEEARKIYEQLGDKEALQSLKAWRKDALRAKLK